MISSIRVKPHDLRAGGSARAPPRAGAGSIEDCRRRFKGHESFGLSRSRCPHRAAARHPGSRQHYMPWGKSASDRTGNPPQAPARSAPIPSPQRQSRIESAALPRCGTRRRRPTTRHSGALAHAGQPRTSARCRGPGVESAAVILHGDPQPTLVESMSYLAATSCRTSRMISSGVANPSMRIQGLPGAARKKVTGV